MWQFHLPELLNRAPLHSSAAKAARNRNRRGAKTRARKGSPGRGKGPRRLGIVLLLVVGISAAQYLETGRVSWPGALLRGVTQTLQEQTGNPDTGWGRITDTLENLGAAREGDPVPHFDLSGRVVRVADGDTVSVLDADNRQYKIRLFGIDTPEQDQPYGTSARRALASLVNDEHVGVVVVETDDYGRLVGTLYHESRDVNAAMVAGGHAWWYQHYAPHERHLAEAEQEARAQGRGLWAGQHPVPPWDWRRGRRRD